MNYVINPSWFYWVSVLSALRITTMVFGLVILVGGAGLSASAWAESYGEEAEQWIKRAKVCAAVSVVLILSSIFIPSESTMIKMMLARFGTYENIETAYNAIIEGAKYILEGLK